MSGLVVNEMVAEEGMPPIVVDADATVTVAVEGVDEVVVASDGRNVTTLPAPTEVTVERTTRRCGSRGHRRISSRRSRNCRRPLGDKGT